MTFEAGNQTDKIVKKFKKFIQFYSIIGEKHNQSPVSDSDREIPILGSTKYAGNSVNLVSGIIRSPSSWVSLSASVTDDRFCLSVPVRKHKLFRKRRLCLMA